MTDHLFTPQEVVGLGTKSVEVMKRIDLMALALNSGLLVDETPLETYSLNGHDILVKREDLCAPDPGPSFSKLRGVVMHIARRTEPVIGVLDTYHSKAGWAVAYTCRALGKECYDFWPRYTADPENVLRSQQEMARAMGAKLVALKAGRSAILYHTAKAFLKEKFGNDAYLMPNALKLPESVTENAAEFERTAPSLPREGTLVISISSGTVASGVLKGMVGAGLDYDVVLHAGYGRSIEATQVYISQMSGVRWRSNWRIVDEGYNYADAARAGEPAPFPANPYYDLKAWRWLAQPGILDTLNSPVIFWNIGA
jgi:hypothetical protein